jgi:hypothetical protein
MKEQSNTRTETGYKRARLADVDVCWRGGATNTAAARDMLMQCLMGLMLLVFFTSERDGRMCARVERENSMRAQVPVAFACFGRFCMSVISIWLPGLVWLALIFSLVKRGEGGLSLRRGDNMLRGKSHCGTAHEVEKSFS